MNDVREALLLPWSWESLDLFLTSLNFKFYPSPGEIMPTNHPAPPPRFLLLSSPSLAHLSQTVCVFSLRSANSFFSFE